MVQVDTATRSSRYKTWCIFCAVAAIAQLGERQTEDLKVPGSIPGLRTRKPIRSSCFASHFPYAKKSTFENNSRSADHQAMNSPSRAIWDINQSCRLATFFAQVKVEP